MFHILCPQLYRKYETITVEIPVMSSSSIDRFGCVTVKAPWD